MKPNDKYVKYMLVFVNFDFLLFLKAYYFPENIGLPVNEDDDDDLYIMQLHYNNPHLRSGKFLF